MPCVVCASQCLHHLPVVVPPGEALSDQLLGLEGLHQLDHLQVGHAGDLGVLGQVEVLLSLQHTLCKGGVHAHSARASATTTNKIR